MHFLDCPPANPYLGDLPQNVHVPTAADARCPPAMIGPSFKGTRIRYTSKPMELPGAWRFLLPSGLLLWAEGCGLAYFLEFDYITCAMLGVVVGGWIGFASGWEQGQQQTFELRLEAQEVLCRMMIEKNTADLLRIATGQSDPAVLQLDDATLDALRPRSSLRARMGRLGQ